MDAPPRAGVSIWLPIEYGISRFNSAMVQVVVEP